MSDTDLTIMNKNILELHLRAVVNAAGDGRLMGDDQQTIMEAIRFVAQDSNISLRQFFAEAQLRLNEIGNGRYFVLYENDVVDMPPRKNYLASGTLFLGQKGNSCYQDIFKYTNSDTYSKGESL
jgi:hypothetical protein